MKRHFTILTVLLILLTVSSCKVAPPVFKSISNVKVDTKVNKQISVGSDIVFYNPNFAFIKVSDIGADVLINNKKVGTIGKLPPINIKPKKDFSIPIAITLEQEAGIKDLLETAIGFFTKKETQVEIKGNVKFKVYCKKYEVPFQHSFPLKLNGGK